MFSHKMSCRAMGRRNYLSVRASLVASFGGILFGYDMGIVSGALLKLREEFQMSCVGQEMLVSCVLFGAFVSSILGGMVIDWIGRKFTMIINCALFIIGALILSFASSVGFLIMGRVLLGLAVGLSVIAECAYISEIAHSKHRGMLVSFNEVAIALGFLLAYLVNYLCISMPSGWRIMFGLSGGLALIQCLALFFIPKSPRFLLVNNCNDEALNVLTRLRGSHAAAKAELSQLLENIAAEKSLNWRHLFSFKNNMHYRLLIGIGLVTAQQLSGLPSVLYYCPLILKQMGFESNETATLASIGTGVTKTLAVIASLLLVDKIGRRKLLISGCVIMSVSLFLMAQLNKESLSDKSDHCLDNAEGIAVGVLERNTSLLDSPMSQSARLASLICMLCYTAAYSIGYGPVTWLILSEIFPSAIKGRAVAFIGAINWAINMLISFTFLDYSDKVNISGVFITYGVACVLSILFIILVVPETKGRDLEEINTSLSTLSVLTQIKSQLKSAVCCTSLRRSESYRPLVSGEIALQSLEPSESNCHSECSEEQLHNQGVWHEDRWQ